MNFIKRLLPPKFKQFLWFVFKSPQRKWLGHKTLMADYKAWKSTRRTPSTLQPVSLCIGIKNRSHNLLNHVLPSLNAIEHKDLIELSIYDCGSNDVSNLRHEIESIWKGKLIYQSSEQKFARSMAFNAAVHQSTQNLILICDADMSLPKDILAKVNRYVNENSAWFPHVWYTNQDGSGRFYTESTGMMAARKSDFLKTGGYDESIKEWGKEDWLLFFEFYKLGIGCIRSNEPEFIHHYHDSLKPEGFVPLF